MCQEQKAQISKLGKDLASTTLKLGKDLASVNDEAQKRNVTVTC